MEDERFVCHHHAALDIGMAGGLLFVLGSSGVYFGVVGLRSHGDPEKAPLFGVTLIVMGLLVAIPGLIFLLIKQWSWIDLHLMQVVQSRRCLTFRWIDRSLALDGTGAFLVKLFNEQAEPDMQYFGCYYQRGFDQIVLLEAETEAEAEEYAADLRGRFPHNGR